MVDFLCAKSSSTLVTIPFSDTDVGMDSFFFYKRVWVTSLNRFHDCSALSFILNKEAKVLDKKRTNLFTYSNYPYFEVSLNNVCFSHYVSSNKFLGINQSVKFLDEQLAINLNCIYPRKIYSLLFYLNNSSEFKLESVTKFFSSFPSKYFTVFLYVMLSISTIFGLLSPYLMLRYFKLKN